MKSFLDKLKNVRNNEGGFSLIEVMVAVVIVAIVLTAGAMAMNSGFTAQSAAEMRTTAVGIGQTQINDIKEKSYTSTRLIQTNDVTLPEFYDNEWTIIKAIDTPEWNETLNEEGIQHEVVKNINDGEYTVETYVTRVNSESFDNAGGTIQLIPTTIDGIEVVEPIIKRVTVVVTWDNGVEVLSTNKTWVRTPSPAECIPPRFHETGSAGNDQWDSQERIQACEGRK